MNTDDSHSIDVDDSIVITGAGLTTSLGLNRHEVWQAILAGRDGIGPLRAIESPLQSNHSGGEAPPLPGDDGAYQREVAYLRHVIREALHEAGFEKGTPYPPERCGFLLGTTLHGMRCGGNFVRSGDFTHLRGFLAGAVQRAAGDLSARGFGGLHATTCSACSSGLAAIGLACTMLRAGELDCVLAGGYDAISEYAYAGFHCMRLVSPGVSRPFSRRRDGMKVAEGYGVMVLERASAARRRGALVRARISGIGESCDSFHLSKPHPEGDGAARAIILALTAPNGEIRPVDLVVAHATATPDNDAAEYAALRRVFGDSLSQVPVTAFKNYLGHTLGGAGAVELILALSALRDGIIPRCLHTADADVEFKELRLCTGDALRTSLQRILCVSLGFGGANMAVVVESPDEHGDRFFPSRAREEADPRNRCEDRSLAVAARLTRAPRESRSEPVYITGIGVVLPDALPWLSIFERPNAPISPSPSETSPCIIPEDRLTALLQARRVRRMSQYAKLTLAAATLGIQDAGLPLSDPLSGGGAILATTHGSAGFCAAYYQQIVKEGIESANPLLFSEGVPNVAAAHLSTTFGIDGFCQTLIGTRTAGLDALRLAAARIRSGEWTRALVVAAEEYLDVVEQAYRINGGRNRPRRRRERELTTGEGAVCLVLESASALRDRSVRAWGRFGENSNDDPNNTLWLSAGGSSSWSRMERLAVRRANGRKSAASDGMAFALPDHWPELFSVGPLVALAAWLRQGRSVDDVPAWANQAICLAYDSEGFRSTVTVERGRRSE